MAKLNTKDIKSAGEGGVPKILQPGNVTCTINGVRLNEFTFIKGAYHLVLSLEGPAIGGDFEGFNIDKDNEKLGKHKGQVGDVKASEWAFADATTKNGNVIERDAEILKFLKSLCTALNINDWLVAQNDKHDTIESLVNALNKEKPFKGIELDYCLCGKEYTNKSGYTAYDLFLPKFVKGGSPFGKNVIKFNPADHIRKKKASESVTDFGGDSSNDLVSSDFQLD